MSKNSAVVELIEHIEAVIKRSVRSGIVTFVTENWQQSFDVDSATLVWGYDKNWRSVLLAKLAKAMQANGSVIGITVRTFTKETEVVRADNGKTMRMPVKEIRCYRLVRINGRIETTFCSKAETFSAHNTDADTGEPIPTEIAAIYCDA